MRHKNHNKYPQYLGIIYAVLAFAAVVSLIYYWQVKHTPLENSFETDPEYVKQLVDYKNDEYQFSVSYDKRFTLDTAGSQPNYFPADGKVLADISIPQSVFPKTNLTSAHVAFAVKENSTAATCRNYVTAGEGSAKRMTKSAKLRGDTVYWDEFEGAAAGTRYKTKIYRIFQNDICYESNLTVGIASIENYEPDAVSEVVEADVWNELSVIFISLKFDDLIEATL